MLLLLLLHHMAQHHPTRSETPPYAPQSRFVQNRPLRRMMLMYGATQS